MSAAINPHETHPTCNGNFIAFPVEEILVSATDERGVLKYANEPFCRVAGYSQTDLIKAPHRIVRHKEMPRGLFHLVWGRLKRGKAIGAYIKNRSKAGDYYWVFGVITPMEQGFLSVRIKPQSAFFETAKRLYPIILAGETNGLTPDRSSSLIRKVLQQEGFATYSDFMEQALAAEFEARAKAMGHKSDALQSIDALAALIIEMRSYTEKVGSGFKQVRGEPVNLRILAGRLEGTGAALATISQNYDDMAKDMYDLVGLLNAHQKGALSVIETAIAQGKSAIHVADLMEEAATAVVEREATDNAGKAMLEQHCARLQRIGRSALADIASASLPIPDICRRVRRRINGLDVVKLLCKVESGRMQNRDTGLDGIIHRLERFHEQTDRDLATLMSKAVQIRQKSSAL